MKTLATLLLGAVLCGCATDAPRIVEYRYVAYSWTGGNISDMIEAWGTPRAGHDEATAATPGHARWRVFSRTGGGGSGSGSGGIRYFCDTIARFDMDGTIYEIEIRQSDNCDRYYRDLGSMLRPGVKPPTSTES